MANNKKPVMVIGLGRFGSSLAKELTVLGTPVLAVDSDPELVQRYSTDFSRIAQLDATDPEALAQIGIEEFHTVIVAIGGDQQSSILTTSVLSDLDVPQIWAKALSTQHARILERVGAHKVIQPENEMGARVAHLVSDNLREYLEIAPDWVLVRTTPPREFVGVPLGQTRLRKKTGVTIVSVKSTVSNQYDHADSSTVLNYDDEILVVGRPDEVERFTQLG